MLPIIGIRKIQVTKVRKITGLEKKSLFLVKLRNTGANPINIITPTPKFWCCRNYNKSLFQSYKAVFSTQNYAKRHFWHKFWCKILPSNLCKKIGIVYVKNEAIKPK
jgi:hypothetical protein